MPSTPSANLDQTPFGRVLTAMVTPFTDDGTLDLAAAQALATHLVDQGNDGLVVSGTTGDSPTTTDDEKAQLVRAVVEAVGDRAQVVAGVGTNDTAHSVEGARQAAEAGADGLLVVTPYYSKPPQSGLLAHFTTVADATELPVMLYDIPGRTGTAIRTETLVRLGEHERIVAVKDAKGDLYEGAWVMARSDLAFYSGDDAANLAWLAHGAVGMVSVVSHVASPHYRAMVEAVLEGDLNTAQRIYRELLPAVRGIMTRTQGAIMAKAALQLQGVLSSRAVRLPLVEATSDEVSLLKTDLSESALLEGTRVSHPHPELSPPPPLAPGALRVVPLGGLGEVGRNMAVLEFDGKLLIIDCGVLFPEDHQPGVDLILPDFEYISDRLDDIVAVVLTHGHEDHIGAVPYLLRLRQDIPLVGSQLTLALVEAKLKEHRITPLTLGVREGQTEQFGPFACEFVAVNHSIPDALAVAVTTGAGTVLHTGDFKMDQLPLDGRITDLRAFARLGEAGVDLFMVDSTNAEVPGFTVSEREIAPVLDRVFAGAERRLIVASFASHVHRVQQVLNAAHAHGRRVALVGRSMVRNMGVAKELGYLNVPDGVLIDVKAVDDLPDDQVVLMCTGSQGEPMAALSRMAGNDHRVRINAGDTVVLASSLIPGNENAVFRVINGLTRLGAKVVHQGNAKVHVSGHASAGELLYCYNILRPRNVMPVHGETRHLVANRDIAVSTGIPYDRVVMAEDGVVVDLQDGVARVVGAVPCGYVYVDGSSVGEITDADLKDRRILGEEGFISIVVVVDSATGKIVAGPEIHARGFAEGDEVFDGIRPQLESALAEAIDQGTTDNYQLQQVVRRVVGRWVGGKLRRRPMIIPVVVSA